MSEQKKSKRQRFLEALHAEATTPAPCEDCGSGNVVLDQGAWGFRVRCVRCGKLGKVAPWNRSYEGMRINPARNRAIMEWNGYYR